VVLKLLALTEEEIITFVIEQIIPEIDIDKVNKISGMDILCNYC
jgi:ribosomal protein L5